MLQVAPPAFVTVDGRKLAYDEVCPPDPKGTVLLLTGLGAKRLGWYRQLPVFGQVYRTIALDHRDTGDSDPSPGPYTTADQADDAAAVLRALGVARAHVVGISMGGFIALELTLRHPELVDKAKDYFKNVQNKDMHYQTFLRPADQPAIWLNQKTMEKYRPQMKTLYYDPSKYDNYLQQLGIKYPTVRGDAGGSDGK